MPTKKSSTPARKAPAKAAPAAKKAAPAATKKPAVPTKAAPAKRAAPGKAPAKAAPVAKKAPAKAAPVAKKAPAKAAPVAKKAPAKATKKGAGLDKFLEAQLKALGEERAVYTRQATALRAEADQLAQDRDPGDVQFDEESGQGDSMNVERERDLALSAQALAAVDEIDRAIEKIHLGTYGVCEKCHENIPKERLRALPYAALCVKCKTGGLSGR
jgi:DnaK suppressor protein